MTTQTALATVEAQALQPHDPSIGEWMQQILTADISPEKVTVLKDLLRLGAEQKFNRAFTLLQSEMPAVQAMKPVPNKDGSVRYRFAPYPDIMRQIQPMLTKHGFSVRFSSTTDEKRVAMTCTLMHADGHSVSNEFSVRVGQGPPGSSEAQADGSAASYAQRGALCDALNIVVRTDDDARLQGDNQTKVTPEQAFELERRVKELNRNVAAFLQLADAKTFEEILARRYDYLDEQLRRQENKKP